MQGDVDAVVVVQPAGRTQGNGQVTSRLRLQDQIRQAGALVTDRVDEDDPGAVHLRILQYGDEVDIAGVGVFAPQHNGAAVHQVGQVTAVGYTEVGQLGRFSRSAADVTSLHRCRAEPLEEQVGDMLHHPQGAAGTVMQDRLRPGFIPELQQA
jgi:hypothetical protein